ncbi:MAG: type II secretion system F family protein [Rhodobacterales bacterium]|nr:type II secretion system F family protein [Rhodobacterales bacterium]
MIESLLDLVHGLGQATASLAVASAVFVGIFLLALRAPSRSRLDLRARLVAGRVQRAGREVGSPLNLLRRLTGHLPWDHLRQQAVDWFSDHVVVGEQKRLQLVQAGFRQPKTYLYFEVSRIIFGVAFAALCLFALETLGVFRMNAALGVALGFLALMFGLFLPGLYLRHRIAARRRAFAEHWDDALGLLVICLDAGLSIEIAMRRIARELATTAPVLAEELIITVTDLALLKERKLAYLALSTRIDVSSVKSVTIALVQAEKQGASIANSLRTISQSNRDARVTAAEEKAAALGPKMTVPMIVFFLPVIFVIIMAPMVMNALD